MSEATLEKAVCGKCGVDVRENTLFCYNCGSCVAEDPATVVESNGSEADIDAKTKAALDDMVERFRIDEIEDANKLANAAAERRKACVRQRKPREFVWEPPQESSNHVVFILAVSVAVFAAIVVFLTVFLK